MLQNKIETMQVTIDEMKGKIDKLEGDVAFLRRIRK
jgi:peptidoglycan hydrolase CwlO-like protein